MSETVLRLERVSKQFESPGEETPPLILDRVDLEVRTGQTVGILGPSGSGKTTLLNLIGTLDRPTSGKILFQGRDVTQLDERELALLRNREIGFVFQLHHLLPQLSILENVLVPTLVSPERVERSEWEDRAVQLLERVGLGHRIDYRPGQISGGERQRAAVVRALMNRPSLLLADEPTGALDQDNAAALFDLLLEINREQDVTLICVTHSIPLAQRLSTVFEIRGKGLVPVRDEASRDGG